MHIQGLFTLGGLVLSIQRFHLWRLQLDIYHNKVQQYQWRYFHYTSLYAQWRPTSFKNTLLINLALSQNYKQQMNSIHWSTIISSRGNPTHPLQSCGSPTHYTIGIIAVLCSFLTIYLRRLHIDLHEDQPLHQLNQSYYSSYGTFCCIKSAHTQRHLFCYPSSTIRFNNMIITYGSINTIMIMQPIL